MKKCRKHKKHTPQSPMKHQHYLGRLFGNCTIQIETPQDNNKFTDLVMTMLNILERLELGQLDSDDSNDMGAYGNLCTLVASEGQDEEMYDLAQQWNELVSKMRARFRKWGKWELTGEEYLFAAVALKILNAWLITQSQERLGRAWTVALAACDDMLQQGHTEWITDDPINDLG